MIIDTNWFNLIIIKNEKRIYEYKKNQINFDLCIFQVNKYYIQLIIMLKNL